MKTRKNIKEYLNQRGFTIMETLVAIFILVISITGPLSFAQSGLRAAYLARDQITAFFLAQDAIETIRNIRDQNELDCGRGPGIECGNGHQDNWLAGLDECLIGAGPAPTSPCNIDTTLAGPAESPDGISTTGCTVGGDCPALRFNSSEGTFGLLTGTPSIFRRTVYINENNDERSAQVVVVVSWRNNANIGDRQIVVQQDFLNWYPNNSN